MLPRPITGNPILLIKSIGLQAGFAGKKRVMSTKAEKKIDDELHTLLAMMPTGSPELAMCADAVIDLIRQPEKIADVILSWIAKLSMALSWNEQAFYLEGF